MDDDRTGPVDPITSTQEMAVQMHELYEAYMAAGFPEHRAYDLVLRILLANIEAEGGQ